MILHVTEDVTTGHINLNMNQSESSNHFVAVETKVMLAELANFHLYQFASDF